MAMLNKQMVYYIYIYYTPSRLQRAVACWGILLRCVSTLKINVKIVVFDPHVHVCTVGVLNEFFVLGMTIPL